MKHDVEVLPDRRQVCHVFCQQLHRFRTLLQAFGFGRPSPYTAAHETCRVRWVSAVRRTWTCMPIRSVSAFSCLACTSACCCSASSRASSSSPTRNTHRCTPRTHPDITSLRVRRSFATGCEEPWHSARCDALLQRTSALCRVVAGRVMVCRPRQPHVLYKLLLGVLPWCDPDKPSF